MMRKVFSVALMAAMVCLVGMTRDAGANVTISLVWDSTTGTGAGVGTNSIAANVGDTIVLSIVMTTDEVLGASGVSLMYDADLANELDLVAVGAWAGSTFGTTAMTTVYAAQGPIPNPTFTVESTGAVAGNVSNYNSAVSSGPLFLPIGTYVIGTAAFSVNSVVADGIDIQAWVDPLLDAFGGSGFVTIPSSNITLGGAIVNVPEPGTVSLLGLGLVGLVLAGRRSRRS